MPYLFAILGGALIIIVLLDAFESIVLPRRVTRRIRLARIVYRVTWRTCRVLASRIETKKRRETYLSYFGPFSLLLLLAFWAGVLVFGYALVQWGLNSTLNLPSGNVPFSTYLYLSGSTFFTLGFGDVTPVEHLGRTLTVIESGTGIGFLAIVIGYLPVIYQAFSRREVGISLLDARAGSPPTAAELIRRHGQSRNLAELDKLLGQWERWSAEFMESHLSYPVLSYYRSQHDNQSWIAALTTILDTCSLVLAGIEGIDPWTARLAFAMARHAVVDLSQSFNTPPLPPSPDRLPASELARLRESLAKAGVSLRTGPAVDEKLFELRQMYEPYVNALASYLLLPLPPWIASQEVIDNWRTSAWQRLSSGEAAATGIGGGPDDH